MDQVFQGMVVEDAHGPIGVVQRVDRPDAQGRATIVIERHDGTQQTLQPDTYAIYGDVLHVGEVGSAATTDRSDPLRTQVLPTTRAGTTSATALHETLDVAPGQDMTFPVIREEAVVQKREVERGGVRVHKTVNEREEVVEQPTYREDVAVERIPIGRVIEAAPAVREEGDTLIIPVVEEMLVVEKRLVLKEEVRITRRRTQDTEQARVVLREEQVHIEEIDEREAGV